MSEALFADDLYGDNPDLAKFHGCGLKGWCDGAGWEYQRHGDDCRPGLWHVSIFMKPADDLLFDFIKLLQGEAHAVMDDFGSLRRVA